MKPDAEMSTNPSLARPSLASEARDRLLARVAFEAIWERDLASDAVRWDGNLESIFGYPLNEVVGHTSWWRERVHPDDLERVEQVSAQAIRGDAPGWSSEYRFRRKNGSWAWVASRCAIERDARGQARRAVGAMIDISKLKDTESRLRLFTEQIPARACATDRELRVVWDTGAAYPANPSVVGKTVPELFAQSPDRERVLEGCRKALAGESSRLEIDDGTAAAQLQLEPFRDPAGNVIGVVGIAFDITARVRTEEEVRVGQRLLRQVLDTLPVGVIVLDRAGDILLGNSASSGIWGGMIVSGPERRAKSKGFWHGSGKAIRPDEWASLRALVNGETSRDELIDIETFDSQHKTIENYAAPIRDAKGTITGAVVVNKEVTERVRAEEALRKTERLLIEAEKLGQTGSWEQDLLSGQIYNSEANRRLFFGDDRRKGARLEDYVEAVHPDDRGWVQRRREELLAGTGPSDIEYRVVWPDGSVHWIFGRATVVRDESARPVRVYGTNADITERKRAEDELARRARQQAAIAQLSLSALAGGGLQPLFEEASALIARTLGVDYGAVLEWLPDKELMEFRAGSGPWVDETVRRIAVPTTPGSMAEFYMASRAPVVVTDLAHEARFSPGALLLEHGVKSGIAAPIPGTLRPYGVLEASARQVRVFTEDEVNFTGSMASVLASSVEQRQAACELVEKRQQLEALSRKLIEAQEAERRAVARELHDDFGQVLTALKLNLQRRDRDDGESIALVDGAIGRMRDLAQDLRPPLLDEFGLDASLSWYVEREAKRAGLTFRLALAHLEQRPPAAVETTCFRVAQEALTNVIRHAQARAVEVELSQANSTLQLVVRDDGRGFDVLAARRRAAHGGSQGLLSMQERVALAGGDLEIDSAPGRGTSIRVRLPLAAVPEP